VGATALEQVLDRRDRRVRQRDQEVGPDEDVELGRVQPADGLVEDREVQDDEQVVLVLVDLRALVAREDVLVVERVELEALLQPRAVDLARALDVDPAEAGGLDDLDARRAVARERTIDERPRRRRLEPPARELFEESLYALMMVAPGRQLIPRTVATAATSIRTPNCSPFHPRARPSRTVRWTMPASDRRRLVGFAEAVTGDHRPRHYGAWSRAMAPRMNA
jgi:hypothetical protein